MPADIVEVALERFTDWTRFEALASEIMRSEGYPDIKPLGGPSDFGQDAAVERFYQAEGRRRRTIFQYTVQAAVASKVRRTVERLDEAKVQYQELIIVTPTPVSTETQFSGSARLNMVRFHRVHGGEPRGAGGQIGGAGRRGRGRPEIGAPASPSGALAGKRGPGYADVTFGAGRRWVSR